MNQNFILCLLISALFLGCAENAPSTDENNSAVAIENTETNDAATSETEPDEAQKEDTTPPQKGCKGKLGVYLSDPDRSGTNIRKTPKGEIVHKLVVDEQNHDYLMYVIDAQDGWFKIESPIMGIENDVEIKGGSAWIHSSVVAADTRNYGAQPLKLLTEPENGETVTTITEPESLVRFKDFCGKWAKVEYNGKVGWIEVEWLCGNPLTSCS